MREVKKPDGLVTNSQILEFINGDAVKLEVFASEASLQKDVIDKMNGIAKESKELSNE